jgi:hypothetical protein
MEASIHPKLHKINDDDSTRDVIEKRHKCMCIQNEAETQDVMYMNNHTVSPYEHKFSPSDFRAYAFSVHLFFFLSFPSKGMGRGVAEILPL